MDQIDYYHNCTNSYTFCIMIAHLYKADGSISRETGPAPNSTVKFFPIFSIANQYNRFQPILELRLAQPLLKKTSIELQGGIK